MRFAKMLADASWLERAGVRGRIRCRLSRRKAGGNGAVAAAPAKKLTAERVAKPKAPPQSRRGETRPGQEGPARKAASAKTARPAAHAKTKAKGGARRAGARTTKPAARGKATKKR
jgi:hypothetical protein